MKRGRRQLLTVVLIDPISKLDLNKKIKLVIPSCVESVSIRFRFEDYKRQQGFLTVVPMATENLWGYRLFVSLLFGTEIKFIQS